MIDIRQGRLCSYIHRLMRNSGKTASAGNPCPFLYVSALAIIAATAVISPALGSSQVVPLGSSSISLDFGGEDVEVIPLTVDYEECTGLTTYYARLVDSSTKSSSFVYLMASDNPRPAGDLEKEIRSIMTAMCSEVSFQQWNAE